LDFPRDAFAALALIWCAGVLFMLLYGAVSAFILRKRLRTAVPVAGADAWAAADLQTPFIFGLFRPRVYVPPDLPATDLACVLRHEQAHIRRGDHWVKFAAFCVLALHWFNPLVWLAFRCMSDDMEFSCDERVLREMGGGSQQAYAASLLTLAAGGRPVFYPPAFGEGNVKSRIKHALNYKLPGKWAAALALAAVILLVAGLAADRGEIKVSEEYFGDEHYINSSMTFYRYNMPMENLDPGAERDPVQGDFSNGASCGNDKMHWDIQQFTALPPDTPIRLEIAFTDEPPLIMTKTPRDYMLARCQAYKAASAEGGIGLDEIHISPHSITMAGWGFDNKTAIELELANGETMSLGRGKFGVCHLGPQGTTFFRAFYTKIDPAGCRAIIIDGTRITIKECDYYPFEFKV
jgi:hypothetical protein